MPSSLFARLARTSRRRVFRALAVALVALPLGVGIGGCASNPPLPPKAIALNGAGAVALANGNLELAYARLALALEYNPRFTEAWVNLGLVEERRGNFDLARRDFVKARDLNPDLPAPHHALGVLADAEGHTAEAEKLYRAALKVDPGFAPARINLARRLFARGDFEEAREHFLRLTQVAPDALDGWTGLCETLLKLDRRDDARAVAGHAREAFGDLPAIALLEARFLLFDGRYDDAAKALEPLASRANRPQKVEALAWLAVARLGEGDVAGATDAAERATSLDPDDAVARYALRTARDAHGARR
ncbi:MAG TPA: tetratricopeptide repeat protein [Polyangiaceae bacterium]|jgi:Flp pilus assembly protein TadD